MKYLQSAEKKEFIRNLVSKYMQIENLKEEYQRELSKLDKKPQIDQHNKLASTIVNLVMKYKQDEDVECIHLEVICDGEIEYNNLYYLYVVCNNTDIDALENKYKKDNTKYSRKDDEEELGGWLHIIAVPTYFYEETADYYEVAQNLLLTNDILYDKTGRYSQMKDAANRPYNREVRVLRK